MVGGIVVFVILGMWQLQRHDEKTDLRDRVEQAMSTSSVVPIEEVPKGAFRRITAVGEYQPRFESKVLRSRDGVSGYEVLTPLVLTDGTAVLVDRGWAQLDVDYTVGGALSPGPIVAEGLLWPAEDAGEAIDLPEFIKRIDPRVFASPTGLAFRSEYLVLIAQSPLGTADLVLPEVREISLGPHLGYAGQWFLFAGVTLVGYPLLLRRQIGFASTPG